MWSIIKDTYNTSNAPGESQEPEQTSRASMWSMSSRAKRCTEHDYQCRSYQSDFTAKTIADEANEYLPNDIAYDPDDQFTLLNT